MPVLCGVAEEAHEYVIKALYGPDAEPREGISETLTELLSGRSVILSAPPGYGKTNISYCLGYLAATRPELCQRAIHVLPLRSIIEDCYARLFRENGELRAPPLVEGVVARQSLDASGSPWLQRKLVITTLDTFTMCSMRLPPAEARLVVKGLSLGHGFLARAAILSSTIVFDEVHLFLEESGKMASAFSALLRWLSMFSTPVCVMSATLPPQVEEFLKRELSPTSGVKVLKYGEGFRDEGFEAQRLQVAECLRTERPREGGVKALAEEALIAHESYERVLVVLNTVADCIEVARTAREAGYKPVILHGKIARKHRLERLKALKGPRWIAICTQVVEAGVDVSALYLVTDAAPPCALVQRAGRTLRYAEDVGREGVISVFLDKEALAGETYKGIYDIKLVRASVDHLREHHRELVWHLPKGPGRPGYEDFIGECYARAGFTVEVDKRLARSLTGLLRGFITMKRIVGMLELLGGSFVRDEPLVLGFVNHLGLKEGAAVDREVWEKLASWQLPLSAKDVLRTLGGDLLALTPDLASGGFIIRRERVRSEKNLVEKLLKGHVYGVLVPPELYNEELGLLPRRMGR